VIETSADAMLQKGAPEHVAATTVLEMIAEALRGIVFV